MQIDAILPRTAHSAPAAPAAQGLPAAAAERRRSSSVPSVAAQGRIVTPVRGGLRSLDVQRNLDATAVQRTLAFVGAAQAGLRALKKPLSEAVAGRTVNDEALHAPLQRFAALWQTRAQATNGSLDGQLRVLDAGQAQQAFSMRGLDAQSLVAAEQEQLQLVVKGQQSNVLTLEPGLPPANAAKRFDQVLAPLGVRAALDEAGELQFRTAETEWPAVRDSLAVRGSGRLFPAGQFNRVRTEIKPEIVQPHAWRVDDPFALRRTLQEVVRLGVRLDAVTRQAGSRLEDLAEKATSDVAATEDLQAERALQIAESWRDRVAGGSFTALAEMSAVMAGLGRERVESLLDLQRSGLVA